MDSQELHQKLSKSVKQLMWVLATLALTLVIAVILYFNREGLNQKLNGENTEATDSVQTEKKETGFWQAVDLNLIKDPAQKELVWYGKELISHTSKYLGPKGSVTQISNGMNCQNCHLDAGTKVFGNNYGSVAANYPKFRARSGAEEDIYKRVNDCFERSLNGKALDTLSKEMQAIKAYITYIGSNTEKGKKAEGSGFKELTFLDRAADPKKGKEVYTAKCQSCHQSNGQGLLNAEGTEYSFPPLWGKHAYNDKAGLYRITFFARYAKYNMPLGASHENPQLTDEEAWDIAAYVNSQPRPTKATPNDWPDISKKPIDHPFGPFSDGFSETQHKFGPFKPIKAAKEASTKKQS